MKLSSHFTSEEFICSCCGGYKPMSTLLITMLEKVYAYMNAKAIIISSGYRCENNPWGYKNDAHRKAMAADLCVQKQDGSFYSSWDIAEVAERLGFRGIGIIDNTYVHLDTRGHEPFVYDFWFGNEMTGENYTTFQRGTVFYGDNNKPIETESDSDTSEIKLQKILNTKGAKLTVDGIIGKLSLTELRHYTIEPNDSGELTKWTQEKLKSIGYNVDINGTADKKTMDAIHKFQKDNGLGEGTCLSGGDWGVLIKISNK